MTSAALTNSLAPGAGVQGLGKFHLILDTSADISHSSTNLLCCSLVVGVWSVKPLGTVLSILRHLSLRFSDCNPLENTECLWICSKEGVCIGKSLGREKKIEGEGGTGKGLFLLPIQAKAGGIFCLWANDSHPISNLNELSNATTCAERAYQRIKIEFWIPIFKN